MVRILSRWPRRGKLPNPKASDGLLHVGFLDVDCLVIGNKKKLKENFHPFTIAEAIVKALEPPMAAKQHSQIPVSQKPSSQTPPSSPSKRRQSSSHYSDVDCSPSKRRGVNAAIARMSLDERGLLFNMTNSPMKVDDTRTGNSDNDVSWIGSPMKVDNDAGKRRRKEVMKAGSITEELGAGSPMRVDGDVRKSRKAGSTKIEVLQWQKQRKGGRNVDLCI
jgi:hypothetical protein